MMLALVLLLLTASAAGASPYVIRGRGYGHGVGMSQWGAYGFARHGRAYDWILRHYYRGTTLGTAPDRAVRVLLQSGQPSISFAGATSAGAVKLRAARTYTARLRRDGRIALNGRALPAPLLVSSAGGAVRLGGRALNGVLDGAYRGAIELSASSVGGLTAVNVVDLEGYVKGVVPAEVPASWPGEALKAQAVAARSYALATQGLLFPDTRSQVYKGLDGEAARSDAAVDATSRRVVLYHGRIAITYFFSASGGHTENVEDVFYGAPRRPYLRGVKDPFDGSAPRHRWQVSLTTAQVQARLAGLVKGSFRGIRVLARGDSPRVVWAEVVGSSGVTHVRGATLEARLGLYDTWAYFPSLGGSRRSRAQAPSVAGRQPPRSAPSAPRGFRWPAAAWDSRG